MPHETVAQRGSFFDPWIGPQYIESSLKLLILGESRYDEDFTDREVIKCRLDGGFESGQKRTFTKFERAVLGQDHSESDAKRFWNSTVFHNYNVTFFPGQPRIQPGRRMRADPQNGSFFQRILREHKPTHSIVWGMANWESLDSGSTWTDGFIGDTGEPCSATTVGGHTTLFMRVRHPASAFSPTQWNSTIRQFLRL